MKKLLLFFALSLSLAACGEKDDPQPVAATTKTTVAATYYVTGVTINSVTGNPTGRYRLVTLFSQSSDTQAATELYRSPARLDVTASARLAVPDVAVASGLRIVIYDAMESGQRLAQLGSISINPPTQAAQSFAEGATSVTVESHR